MAVKCIEVVLWTYWTICGALVALPVVIFVAGITLATAIDTMIEWAEGLIRGRDDD